MSRRTNKVQFPKDLSTILLQRNLQMRNTNHCKVSTSKVPCKNQVLLEHHPRYYYCYVLQSPDSLCLFPVYPALFNTAKEQCTQSVATLPEGKDQNWTLLQIIPYSPPPQQLQCGPKPPRTQDQQIFPSRSKEDRR